MKDMKEFLRENLPPDFQVSFTLIRKNGGAVIAGEIVMCDGLGAVLERSGMLCLPPGELYQAAEDLSILDPSREEFFDALKLVLRQNAGFV